MGSVFGASDAQTLWAGNQGDAGPVGDRTLDAQTIACVISGGKIDNDTLATILRGEIPIKEH